MIASARPALAATPGARVGGRVRVVALVVAVALHASAMALLLAAGPTRPPETAPIPLTVHMIEPPPVVEPPKPVPPPPKAPPKPVAREKPVPMAAPPAPLLAAEAPGPATFETPRAPPDPPPPPATPVAPGPPAPPPAPPALVAPSFDAAYLENPAPSYPQVSRRLGEQGRVLLRVHVSATGAPLQVALDRSSGHERLDRVAADTVRRWRFVPARRGDEAVAGWVIVPIVFKLGG